MSVCAFLLLILDEKGENRINSTEVTKNKNQKDVVKNKNNEKILRRKKKRKER